MGYYKDTTYYGPNCEDHADTSSEARAERRPFEPSGLRRPAASRPYVGRWPDLAQCLVCETKAPGGQAWIEGICPACRAL
jgi:hypothetical protein